MEMEPSDVFFIVSLYLFLWLLLWVIGMRMAERRGRNKVLWFIWWLFLNIYCYLYYLIAGDSPELKEEKIKKQKEEERRQKQEDRLEFLAMLEAVKK